MAALNFHCPEFSSFKCFLFWPSFFFYIYCRAKLCVKENIPVISVPGPCALVAAFSSSGPNTVEFAFRKS